MGTKGDVRKHPVTNPTPVGKLLVGVIASGFFDLRSCIMHQGLTCSHTTQVSWPVARFGALGSEPGPFSLVGVRDL